MGLQGASARGEKTKNLLLCRDMKQQGSMSTDSCEDESWHQFLPEKPGKSLGVIGSCPSSASAIRAVQTWGNIFGKNRCISPAKFLYDSWEDLSQNTCWDFKSKPFLFQPVSSTGPSLSRSMEGMSECQEFRKSRKQTHIMGRLTTQPRLLQDFWWWWVFLSLFSLWS